MSLLEHDAGVPTLSYDGDLDGRVLFTDQSQKEGLRIVRKIKPGQKAIVCEGSEFSDGVDEKSRVAVRVGKAPHRFFGEDLLNARRLRGSLDNAASVLFTTSIESDSGTVYPVIVLEYIDGVDFREVDRQNNVADPETLASNGIPDLSSSTDVIAVNRARAMGLMSLRGKDIVHLDITKGNFMVGQPPFNVSTKAVDYGSSSSFSDVGSLDKWYDLAYSDGVPEELLGLRHFFTQRYQGQIGFFLPQRLSPQFYMGDDAEEELLSNPDRAQTWPIVDMLEEDVCIGGPFKYGLQEEWTPEEAKRHFSDARDDKRLRRALQRWPIQYKDTIVGQHILTDIIRRYKDPFPERLYTLQELLDDMGEYEDYVKGRRRRGITTAIALPLFAVAIAAAAVGAESALDARNKRLADEAAAAAIYQKSLARVVPQMLAHTHPDSFAALIPELRYAVAQKAAHLASQEDVENKDPTWPMHPIVTSPDDTTRFAWQNTGTKFWGVSLRMLELVGQEISDPRITDMRRENIAYLAANPDQVRQSDAIELGYGFPNGVAQDLGLDPESVDRASNQLLGVIGGLMQQTAVHSSIRGFDGLVKSVGLTSDISALLDYTQLLTDRHMFGDGSTVVFARPENPGDDTFVGFNPFAPDHKRGSMETVSLDSTSSHSVDSYSHLSFVLGNLHLAKRAKELGNQEASEQALATSRKLLGWYHANLPSSGSWKNGSLIPPEDMAKPSASSPNTVVTAMTLRAYSLQIELETDPEVVHRARHNYLHTVRALLPYINTHPFDQSQGILPRTQFFRKSTATIEGTMRLLEGLAYAPPLPPNSVNLTTFLSPP